MCLNNCSKKFHDGYSVNTIDYPGTDPVCVKKKEIYSSHLSQALTEYITPARNTANHLPGVITLSRTSGTSVMVDIHHDRATFISAWNLKGVLIQIPTSTPFLRW